MTRAALLQCARDYADNVPPAHNVFGSHPSFLRRAPWSARTRCSSFQSFLIREALGWSESKMRARFGRVSPLAEEYHRAIVQARWFDPQHLISTVRPGDHLAIRFGEEAQKETGFTGHAALIEGEPVERGPVLVGDKLYGRWNVPVIDSTSTPHGVLDSRATRNGQGIGRGTMILVTDDAGWIVGYAWSANAEPSMNAHGLRDVQVGALKMEA